MKNTLLTSICLITAASVAAACDICGCYTPNPELNSEPFHPDKGGFFAALAEQYTFFGTTKRSGKRVPNVADQHEHSSITQAIGGYNLNDRLGIQVNVPLIERDYKRPEGFKTDRGDESGLGDVSLLVNYVAVKIARDVDQSAAGAKDHREETGRPKDFTFSFNVLAGVKLATGDPSRIKEEFNEVEVEGAPESGIHGHDLALGSGSCDASLGAGIFTRCKRAFFQADVQYTVRTEGSYDYRYANDLSFDVGPGWFFLQNHSLGSAGSATLGMQFVVNGEHKNRDTFQGEVAADTGITALYVGPRLVGAIGSRLVAEAGADLPVVMDNTAFQGVPTYRVRAGFSYRF